MSSPSQGEVTQKSSPSQGEVAAKRSEGAPKGPPPHPPPINTSARARLSLNS